MKSSIHDWIHTILNSVTLMIIGTLITKMFPEIFIGLTKTQIIYLLSPVAISLLIHSIYIERKSD